MYLDILTKLIVILIPGQLGIHFWPSFSRVSGIKIDYLSPTLYALDVLLVIYIIFSIAKIIKYLKANKSILLGVVILIALNLISGESIFNSLFWWLRSVLYCLVFMSLRLNKISWKQVKYPILVSSLFIIIVQIIQVISGHSVGGLLYFMGERYFSASTRGMSYVSIADNNFLRGPSIFSHPNSLAGYLVVVYLLLQKYKSPFWQRMIIFLSVLLTFSKSAYVSLAVVVLFKVNPVTIIGLSIIFSIAQVLMLNISTPLLFISDRQFLVIKAIDIIKENLLTGVGLGNFVVALGKKLPGSHLLISKLQPVHNLPLLIVSEIGSIGIAFIIGICHRYKDYLRKRDVLSLIAVMLVIGCFDHYFWTLPQNRLIVVLALALML